MLSFNGNITLKHLNKMYIIICFIWHVWNCNKHFSEQTPSTYPTSALSWEITTEDQTGFTDDDTTFTFWTHAETSLGVSSSWPPIGSETTFDLASTHSQTAEISSSLRGMCVKNIVFIIQLYTL